MGVAVKPLVLIYADGSYEEVDAADLARRMDPRALYSKDQPRVPAGSPDGGEWTDTGASAEIRPDPAPGYAMTERLTAAILGEMEHHHASPNGPQFYQYQFPPGLSTTRRDAIRARLLATVPEDEWGPYATSDLGRITAANEYIGNVVDDWATTSVSSETAVRMQYAAKEVHGLTDAAVKHLAAAGRYEYSARSARDRAYVRAEYEATQAWLKAHGITGYVTLYRGQSGYRTHPEDGEHDVVLQPSSSWSLDRATAYRMYEPTYDEDTRTPYLMTARVPVSRIQSIPNTGRGVLPEAEIVVIGGPARVRTSRIHSPNGRMPAKYPSLPYKSILDIPNPATKKGQTKLTIKPGVPAGAAAHPVLYIDADPADADWLKRGGPRALYSADQPRVPAGSPEGGQWTAADSGLPTPESTAMRDRLHREGFFGDPSARNLGVAETRSRELEKRMSALLPPDHPVWTELGISKGRQRATLVEAVNYFREAWALTANGSDTAIRMQRLTKELFAPDGVTSHFDVEGQLQEPPVYPELFAHNAAIARAFVQAEYAYTQQWLKDHGITGEVTLYRGQKGVVTHPPEGDQIVTMQPASSWTTDRTLAEADFAYQVGLNQPYVLATRVPVSRILSLFPTGRGTLREREIIIAGGPIRAQVSYVPVSQVRDYAAARALYSKDQPRDPAGTSTGGQWTKGGGAASLAPVEATIREHISYLREDLHPPDDREDPRDREAGLIIGPDGRLIDRRRGNDESIYYGDVTGGNGNLPSVQVPPGSALVHTHPNSTSFSVDDFRLAAGINARAEEVIIRDIIVIGKDGTRNHIRFLRVPTKAEADMIGNPYHEARRLAYLEGQDRVTEAASAELGRHLTPTEARDEFTRASLNRRLWWESSPAIHAAWDAAARASHGLFVYEHTGERPHDPPRLDRR